MCGVIREDDYIDRSSFIYENSGCGVPSKNPQEKDDPYLQDRVFNHFYDPVKRRPLTIATVQPGPDRRAPDWALGSRDGSFNLPQNAFTENLSRRNHFTVFDAIEYQYRAMTGHSINHDHSSSNPSIAPTRANRNAYWATTFRSLGDVVHLIQDMAQTQHTRNDPHIFTGSRQDKYREIFTILQADPAGAVDQLGDLSASNISSDYAELVITRNEDGIDYAYLIYLIRFEDGVWRIDGM